MKFFYFIGFLLAIFLNADTIYYKNGPKYIKKHSFNRSIQSDGIEYINRIRNSVGLVSFTKNSYLQKSAQNHAEYLIKNDIISHYETSDGIGFTGKTPSDRAVFVGYSSKVVSENLSKGENNSVYNSIDNLMSAIYHRFGFLDIEKNEIGIGYYSDIYVYDMGNSYISDLCISESFSGYGKYYTNICADNNLKIEASQYENSISTLYNLSSDIITWPSENSEDILPVFYEEIPDPLPDMSVSGYPISIEFNRYKHSTVPNISEFKLYDSNGNEIECRLMNKTNDPNNHFNDYQFAIFPLKRLEWNSCYQAKVVYDNNELIWNFKTASLPHNYYNAQNTTYKIIANKEYLFYFEPKDENDTLKSASYSYSESINLDFKWYDQNTIYLKISGNNGDKLNMLFNNGNTLNLVLSDYEYPKPKTTNDNCLKNLEYNDNTQNDINFKKDIIEGWNLIANPVDIEFDPAKLYDKGYIIYTYQQNRWSKNPTTIGIYSGFWIKSNKQDTIAISGNPTKIDYDTLEKNSWQLVGNGVDINDTEELYKNSIIYTFSNKKWTKNPKNIKAMDGFWIKISTK